MATVEWQAVLIVVAISSVIAACVTMLIDRLGLQPRHRSIVAALAWAAYFYLSIVADPSYKHDPVLSGLAFGLLGTAAAQLGEIVSPRAKRDAA